jgi:hypothetical protein
MTKSKISSKSGFFIPPQSADTYTITDVRRGIANLPLHRGKAPPWLFKRMVSLSRSIIELMVLEHGKETLLRRLSDPYWFQSLGCVLGFDWHSSGITTTVCGALKEALKDIGPEIGLFMAGGKGKTALGTPKEIEELSDRYSLNGEELIDISRLTAKVDSVLLQDGYQLYHHAIIFTEDGKWAVIQQGMNEKEGYARRYHWLGEGLGSFVEEPHSGICAQKVHERILLDLTSKDSGESRRSIHELLRDPGVLLRELERIPVLNMPRRHHIEPKDLDLKRLKDTVSKIGEGEIRSFEDVLRVRGLGPKMIRALALVSEIIYGSEPSFKDPARFTFAHGGKDGHPFPVQRDIYDVTVETLKRAIEKAKIGNREKIEAIKKLSRILNQ